MSKSNEYIGHTYETADGTYLGDVRYADENLAKFIADYTKGNESVTIPIKDFLTSKGIEETMLDSILSKISNTVIGTYGEAGTYQYDDEGEMKMLRGQFLPFREDLNPGVTPRDTALVSDRLATKPKSLIETLMHELIGHQMDIRHGEDYEADREIYKKLEKGTTEDMNVGTMSQIIQYLFPDFDKIVK